MLEKLVAYVLNSYLGDYLELNTDQLSVGILSGQVELENIPLKSNSFDKLDLPLQVKSGNVGKICLSIPVGLSSLSSQPWVIDISDVYIIINPKTDFKYDENAVEKQAKANKKKMLQDLEENWKLERQPNAETNLSTYSSWMSYGAGLATNILENLQLNLTNLHIRYENEGDNSENCFSFGFVIDKLSAQSTDQHWVPQYVSSKPSSSLVYKLVELIGLSLYWDTNNERVSSAEHLREMSHTTQHHKYLLEPVSGRALVKRNTTQQPLRSQSEPRLSVELRFEQFSLCLDDLQYSGISSLVREFDLHFKRKPYLQTRPTAAVNNNDYLPCVISCREWWNHAIQSNLSRIRDSNSRCQREYILQRARDCVIYVDAYYCFMCGDKLTHHQNRAKQRIESDIDFDTLKVLRQIAVARVKSTGLWYQTAVATQSSSGGYLSGWVSWYTGAGKSSESATISADAAVSHNVTDHQDILSSASSSSVASSITSQATHATRGSSDSGIGLKLTSTERAKLEEELRDWVGNGEPTETRSALNKDHVYLHLNFVIQQINFKLKQHNPDGTSQGLVQLECQTIQSTATLKPRTRSTKFTLSLGGLYVKDLYNLSTQFPLLISPRQTEAASRSFGGSLGGLLSKSNQSPSPHKEPAAELFFLEIERNPPQSSKDIKVKMKTEALDIIYNEGVVTKVKQFFSPRRRAEATMSKELSEFHLAERARRRYEQLKNKTKIDIRDTWDNLLNTSTVKQSKRVGLRLDISAPQLIVPRDLSDSRTFMVVFDLGRLQVSNLRDSQADHDSLDDIGSIGGVEDLSDREELIEEDDFVTPMSTPPELDSDSAGQSEALPITDSISDDVLTGDNLYSHMYDRYEVLLADIQVLIVNRKDNWRLLTNKGFSHLHIIDKLSVNVLFERRLLLTADPQWPAIKLSAIMESLSIHVSELKLSQLSHCLNKLTSGGSDQSPSVTPQQSQENISSESKEQNSAGLSHSESRFFAPPETRKVLDNSRVVTCGLDIHQMSLDINNKERCLVELQVAGVKADFTQLPSQSDLSLTVHSLIVADALQSYGPDFELLVASHRNVGLDSKSGSMCSSAIASPTSPTSPMSPRSPPRSPDPESLHPPARKQTSYTSFQNAVLSGIQKLLPVATATPMTDHSASSLRPSSLSASDHRPVSPVFVGDPLIKVEFSQAKPESAGDPTVKNVDIVFNTLDLVANQETIVELLAFFNEVMPKPSTQSMSSTTDSTHIQLNTQHDKPENNQSTDLMTIQAEFRKLNILLHRPATSSSTLRPPSGDLLRPSGGDLITPGYISVYKVAMISMMGARIDSSIGGGSSSTVEAELGGLQVTDLSTHSVHSHVFAFGSMNDEQTSVMDQTIPAHMYQTCVDNLNLPEERKALNLIYSKADDVTSNTDSVSLCIGSIQYIHVPRFLNDVAQSVALFQEYIEKAKQKLRAAASEVAENYVYKKRPKLEPMLLCDVDVTLDAPLLVLPCNNNSTEVLVAELGKMTISNQRNVDWHHDTPVSASDLISIQIRDMKMVTKEVDPQKTESFGQEVILEEAGVDIVLTHKQQVEVLDDLHSSKGSSDFYLELSQQDETAASISVSDRVRRSVCLSANVPHALEVSLTRHANELIQQAVKTANQSPGNTHSQSAPSSDTPADSSQCDTGTTSPEHESEPRTDPVHVTADISLPIVSLSIKDQIGGTDMHGIVEVTLEELSVYLEKKTPYITAVKLELTSLSVLDLLQPENSAHRYLALSRDKSRGPTRKFISTSLPGSPVKSLKRKFPDDGAYTSSLPSSITDDNISHRTSALRRDTTPVTPPSSPIEDNPNTGVRSGNKGDNKNLVTIDLILVDKKSPEFSAVYNHLNTNVDIDFNCLELVVNQETWVMVLDFLGMGAKVFTPEQQKEANMTLKTQPAPNEGMKANLSVNSFSVVLVKKCYDLAKANMKDFSAQIIKQQNTTHVKGVLGSLNLDDLSPHGCLHSCKFATLSNKQETGGTSTGTGALQFDVFKHDIPDQGLERDFDISVDLTMTSVIYTHTKRFPIEIINFLQDILEHHDSIGHMRAASQGQQSQDFSYSQVPHGPGHAPRIKMNIKAGTPIIILPGSSLSQEVIVMHMGNLTVTNKFLFAGDDGTLAYEQVPDIVEQVPSGGDDPMTQSVYTPQSDAPGPDLMTSSMYCSEDETLESAAVSPSACLLDVMSVRLTEMDLYSAKRIADHRTQRLSPPTIVDGDIKFRGYHLRMDKNRPLRERCVLNLVVERNLDNDLSHSSPELAIRGELSSVYCNIDVDQYKIVRAVLDQNLGEELNDLQRVAKQLPQIQTILSGDVWTVLDMAIDLRNVTIELLHQHKTPILPSESLARLDFITSKLAFVSYSNQSKDIDLVSQEIRVTDTRDDHTSVFKNILQATGDVEYDPTKLHMEIHLRSNKAKNCASILFNNMRIFCVMDWMISLKDYLSSNPEKLLVKQVPRINEQVSQSLVAQLSEETQVNAEWEVKFNLTDTQVVLVEDLADSSSNAIILKTTAVSHFQPHNENRPLICNLQKMELFSCCLSQETATALSIIDPFDVTVELHKLTASQDKPAHKLEVNLSELYVRFSYGDFLLFKKILKSLPQQINSAVNQNSASLNSNQQGGASGSDTSQDSTATAGNSTESKPPSKTAVALAQIEVNSEGVSICLINDCADMDVPLLELSLRELAFNQVLSNVPELPGTSAQVKFESLIGGSLVFRLSLDYYNRLLSGWEPLMEPWRLKASWTGNPSAADNNLDIKITTENVVNFNITSAVLEMVQQTRDLVSRVTSANQDSGVPQPLTSRESFVPYSLYNQTGRTLLFAVVTKKDLTTSLPTHWTEIPDGDTRTFSCRSFKTKKRHQSTHESTKYRLVVVIEGWQKSTPISIDKVGQFFRTVQKDTHNKNIEPKVVATRVVFDIVCLENSSKQITVKSAITLNNETNYSMETRLESLLHQGAADVMVLPPNTSAPLPLAYVFSQLWFRPAGDEMITYTDPPVNCQMRQMEPGESKSIPLLCNSVIDSLTPYRFSAVMKREYYPSEAVMETLGDDTLYQPGHTITLLPPLTIVNLLPVDLGYLITNTTYTGKLKPGKHTTLHQVDTSKSMKIELGADGFHKNGALYIPTSNSDHMINVRVYDSADKLLLLDARITRLAKGAVKVTISVKYWMINHTGLPLVFRQDGTKYTSAGQFEEHEIARSVAPLMFSYTEREHPDLCLMRLGNSVHPASNCGWSHRFSTDKGNDVRRLRVQPHNGRPEWVYNIGIETSRGVGRYHDTMMTVLVPRNKVINKSSHRLAFTQKHFTKPQANREEMYQASLPGASQAYHWPRQDLDQLLCVKILDIPNTLWSGGFRIDQLSSLVINIRNSESGVCTLMKIETVLRGSTFTTIIADASDIPPPMRIENYTDLSLKYWQTNISHESYKTIVKPTSSVSYAWDEPILPSFLTCSIHCDMGSSENVYNMDIIGQGEHLEYENYFYISLTDSQPDSLVLDVIGGNGIVFSRREPGRRSQLWSHSVEGRLLHEGTTSGKKSYKDDSMKYCLDIAELAVIAEGCSCLALRKVDGRRQTTQIWKFQTDGRLTCGISSQCVQSLPAFGGMQAGARVALGPYDPGSAVGVETAFCMAKMLPGSGVLSVTVDTDGPTRVLRISDIHDLERVKTIQLSSTDHNSLRKQDKPASSRQIKLAVNLPAGLGVSVVNQLREELIYLSLCHPSLTVEQNHEVQTVYLTVRHIQLDNQLQGANCPIIVYTSPRRILKPGSTSRRSSKRSHALELEWSRVLTSQSSMHVFKLFSIQFSSFSLDVDELLLYKMLEMFTAQQSEMIDVELGLIQLPKDQNIDVNVRKYYFALLKVTCGEMTLSNHTVKLPQSLQEVKRRNGMSSFIQFENAVIDFEPFQQLHPFESMSFVLAALRTHFEQEFMSQAAKIIGAIDVLGNPFGLVNDVTTGISGLVTEGNVGGLLKNVTHGASNSLAKVAGTLSHGLGWMTMDDKHDESRDLIKKQYTGSNVLLGFKSLTHGVMGGLTSIAQQTYDGASQRGLEGMLTGLGKGLVGTVTKPVVGVLDFASGAATAIRDTSGGGGGVVNIKRRRFTRCCYGRSGLLPVYSERSARGQESVMFLNSERRSHDRYIDHIKLFPLGLTSYSMLASDQSIYIIRIEKPMEGSLLEAPLSNILACSYVRKERPDFSIKHYLEVKVTQLSESGGSHYRTRNPQFECASAVIAEQVVLLVDHVRTLYEEQKHTVSSAVKMAGDDTNR